MSSVVLTIGPSHSLSEAARLMTERNVGAAIVVDPDSPGPGIITERDILRSVAVGESPTTEKVADHLTEELISASPEWRLEQAADAMLDGGFRHLLVVNGAELQGILSMRDIVRCWAQNRVVS
jgi:CBS domain-containing protein